MQFGQPDASRKRVGNQLELAQGFDDNLNNTGLAESMVLVDGIDDDNDLQEQIQPSSLMNKSAAPLQKSVDAEEDEFY